MRLAVYVKRERLKSDPRLTELKETLKPRGFEFYDIETHEDLLPGTDMLLSVGGDGTFLSASKRVGDTGIPVLGVNLGRLGFLSEYRADDVARSLKIGRASCRERV